MRILLVDDHEVVRREIQRLLASRSDCVVCGEACDGLDAVEKARQLHPDIVLMDISMPRMDGLEAARIIRGELPQSEIVIVTQNEPEIARQQAASVGVKRFVSKASLAQDLPAQIDDISANQGIAAQNSQLESGGAPSSDQSLFSAQSKMSALMRAMDWSSTPLGPTETWSAALRMMVRFMLPNPFPQLLWWGPQLCCLYNDAYIPVLGTKHPWALGKPTAKVWSEVWHVLGPLVDTPFHGGPSTWAEDIPLEVNRNGFMEETHFTIAYSPVPDDTVSGGIGGVLATVHEISEKVVGERRVVILKDLGARSAEPKSVEEACIAAAQTLERYPKDVPFALLYLVDEKQTRAYFAAGAGVNPDDRNLLRTLSLDEESPEVWPFTKAMKDHDIQLVGDLAQKFETLPSGPWADPPNLAAVIPIRSRVAHQLAGFAVVGISSRLPFDENYRNFLDLVSAQISISVANARAYELERERAEALAEIDRAKTAFFSNVSHEFRTPLTLMLGPLQDLLSRSRSQLLPAVTQQLELVNRNGARLLRLVNTLLDFSRIEAGRANAVYQATGLAAFTAELAGVFRAATDRAGLKLEVDCRTTKEVAYVDRDMWEKIVLNLVSNAFKFTFEGEIAVSLAQVGHAAELQIRDTGVGIPSEEIPHLFERFHRVPNTRSRTYEGSGIGLALVNELVKLHGGSIRVESTLGQGTTFFVIIPLGQDHLASRQLGGERVLRSTGTGAEPFVHEALNWLPDLESSQTEELSLDNELLPIGVSSKNSGTPRRRVLIADDNADMRLYLTRLLLAHFEVVAVADGNLALESISQHHPDLVLSDIMMPNVDGFELLRQIRSNPATAAIPVILLSARAGEESRVEGLDAGADDYLVKPFSARELVARVQTHLELSRVRHEANKLVRENEERLRAFVTASSDVVYRMSPDWTQMHYLQGKDSIADTTEPSRDWLSRYIYPDDQANVISAIEKAVRTKNLFEAEHRVIRADGSLGWTFSRAVPLLDEQGEIAEWFGTATDITARKKAEEELREARSNLELHVLQRTQELERAQTDLRDLSGKLLQLQDDERRRIARDLHDSAGQTLTILGMNLAQLAQMVGKDDQLSSMAMETQELVQRLTKEIRTTSYLLHPPLLDDNGIAAALRWYIGGLVERTNLKIGLTVSEELGRLPQSTELALFRIVQESLTNILRHSGSDQAEIRMKRSGDKLTLEVQDHGRGVDNQKLEAINEGAAGVGIRGMMDRVRLLNGEMKLHSDASGTTISVTLPLVVLTGDVQNTPAPAVAVQ